MAANYGPVLLALGVSMLMPAVVVIALRSNPRRYAGATTVAP